MKIRLSLESIQHRLIISLWFPINHYSTPSLLPIRLKVFVLQRRCFYIKLYLVKSIKKGNNRTQLISQNRESSKGTIMCIKSQGLIYNLIYKHIKWTIIHKFSDQHNLIYTVGHSEFLWVHFWETPEWRTLLGKHHDPDHRWSMGTFPPC